MTGTALERPAHGASRRPHTCDASKSELAGTSECRRPDQPCGSLYGMNLAHPRGGAMPGAWTSTASTTDRSRRRRNRGPDVDTRAPLGPGHPPPLAASAPRGTQALHAAGAISSRILERDDTREPDARPAPTVQVQTRSSESGRVLTDGPAFPGYRQARAARSVRRLATPNLTTSSRRTIHVPASQLAQCTDRGIPGSPDGRISGALGSRVP